MHSSYSFESIGARFNNGFLGSDARYTTTIETFDADGDGYRDVLIGNDGQPNELYRNLGNGQFELLPEDFTPDDMPEGIGRHTAGFLIANLTGDVHDDVLVLNTLQSPNELYEGRGDGTFYFVGEYFNGGLASAPRSSVAAITLDSDGDDDFDHIVIGNDLKEPNELYELNAAGEIRYLGDTFNGGIAGTEDRSTVALAALDLDADGDEDLIMGNSDGSNELYENHGKGIFTFVGEHFNDHRDENDRTKDFVLFDADADGDEYLLVLSEHEAPGSPMSSRVALYRNEGVGGFTWVGDALSDSSLSLLFPTDLDSDGKRELVLGYQNDTRCCAIVEPSRRGEDDVMTVELTRSILTPSAKFTTEIRHVLTGDRYPLASDINFGLTTETAQIEGVVFEDENGN
ncbi:MAG: VCBS repeat-containing protein, partial [Patescibacteria group bacterium]